MVRAKINHTPSEAPFGCRHVALADAGVPTSIGEPRWDGSTIARMLRHTADVGRAVFEAAQAQLDENARRRVGGLLHQIQITVTDYGDSL